MAWVWVWYWALVICAFGNAAFYAAVAVRGTRSPYQRGLLLLALPVVVECGWRSLLPSLYLQRLVWWDSPLSAILLERSLACAGELAWNVALGLSLCRLDAQLTGGRRWVTASALGLWLTYVVAEAVSFYNTATTNELWAAVEAQPTFLRGEQWVIGWWTTTSEGPGDGVYHVSVCSVGLDGLSQLMVLPATLDLLRRASGRDRAVLVALATFFILYPLYNFTLDVPMYLRRYEADQKAGKHYFPLGQGLVDAAVTRVWTRRSSDWSADAVWMLLYFVLNPLAATLLAAVAPGTEVLADTSASHCRCCVI